MGFFSMLIAQLKRMLGPKLTLIDLEILIILDIKELACIFSKRSDYHLGILRRESLFVYVFIYTKKGGNNKLCQTALLQCYYFLKMRIEYRRKR